METQSEGSIDMLDNESVEMLRLRHVVTQLELEIEELRHMKKIVPFFKAMTR